MLNPLNGRRFGRLIVIRFAGSNKWRQSTWLCKCKCGSTTVVSKSNLLSGRHRSCGCLLRESVGKRARTHGMSTTCEYRAWARMKDRCYNPRNKAYKYYGKRGITVCKRWLRSFRYFFADMGTRPPKLTLERVNNNGNYQPNNCRWATQTDQNRNSRQCLHLRNTTPFGKKA